VPDPKLDVSKGVGGGLFFGIKWNGPPTDISLALAVSALLIVLVVPLPTILLDLFLAVSITLSVLVLMTALFLTRPLDFTSFPTLLLLSTLLRLSLNVATTRTILTHGHEGPQAAGHVVAGFGAFLMGGDVLVGMIVFAILLVVNFMVVTKGSGRIAEVAARFSLDAMPGKQMAIDADLSAGIIDEAAARKRRSELEQESSFYGAMDGAAKFVRGDAIAGLIITFINLIGGFAIGVGRQGLSFSDAVSTFSFLTVGDGLVSQIPALLVSVAAGIVVTKGGVEGTADKALVGQLSSGYKPLALAAGAAGAMALLPGLPMLPFLALAGIAGTAAWKKKKAEDAETAALDAPKDVPQSDQEPPIAEALRVDLLRLELGYGLLSLASVDGGKLTDQIKSMRKAIAQEMGFVLPAVRIQDNMRLPPNEYVILVKEVEAGRGELRPSAQLVIDPGGGIANLPGDRTTEPTFGLPALWVQESHKDEALARGYTVVDSTGVVTTHLTEIVRENMSELLSFAETKKLLDEMPKEHQPLLGELVPTHISTNGIQRVLQALLSERVSIRDIPTILEGIQEACAGGARNLPIILSIVRTRLARQISDSVKGMHGYIPMITLSADWEQAFAESLVGPPDDRHLAMAPSKLQDFMQRLRSAFDSTAAKTNESAVLVTSSGIRSHVRAIVERVRPSTVVLSQTEIHPKARIRTVGSIG
jgi:flagellar biosynthesis protein FlhA